MKNKHIIHFLSGELMRKEGKARYLCIRAVYPTPEKSTLDKRKVTCKRCKSVLSKR